MEHAHIITAQNVALDHEVAGIGPRILAFLLDRVVLFAWIFGFTMITEDLDWPSGAQDVVTTLLVIFPFLFYHLVSELTMNGQSIGKRALRIKVVRMDGRRPGLGNYLLRWVLRPIDSLMGIGLVVVLVNGRGQRIGDLAAGTTVISLKRRVTLADTLMTTVDASHQVRFPDAIRLSDAQAALIKEVIDTTRRGGGGAVLGETAGKVRTLLGTDGAGLDHLRFLETVLADYVHLTGLQGEGTGHFKGQR